MMRLIQTMRATAAILLAASAGWAIAAKPVILNPAANDEIRGDGADGKNLVRWTTTNVPGFIYTLHVTPLDPANPGGPAIGPTVNLAWGPTDASIVSEGGNTYSKPINFNAAPFAALGTGLFRATLQATDFSFDDTSDPVLFFKGRPLASVGAIDGHNPDALAFGLSVVDPDATANYLYALNFRKLSDSSVVGPFTSTTPALTRSRGDFSVTENQLTEGADYALEYRVADSQPTTAAKPGLTSAVASKNFHFNARPHTESFTGPSIAHFNPVPNNNPTNVSFNVRATDLDNTTVTLTIQISLRDDNSFATGGAFTTAQTVVLQTGVDTPVSVPIPFTGTFWTLHAQTTDPNGIVSPEVPSLNLTIDDDPTIASITASYASDDLVPTSGNRFDFDLTTPVTLPAAPGTGALDNAGVKFAANGIVNTFFNPVTYAWNFGDGTAISTAANPTHVYAKAGNYTVHLVVTDALSAAFKGSLDFPVIINDKPKIDITFVDPGTSNNADNGPFYTSINSPGGAQVDILWRRFNFVRSATENFNFHFNRTGTAIIDDRRGVANIETPTPGNLYFTPADTPKNVADLTGVTSTINVPNGERLGLITKVLVHGLTLLQTFANPLTDSSANAPAIAPAAIATNLASATADGTAQIDLTAAGHGTDNGASPSSLLTVGTITADTSAATADGTSNADATAATATDSGSSAPLIAPGTQSIDASAASSDGISTADFVNVNGADASASAVPASPGTYSVATAAATADSISTSDFFQASATDSSVSPTLASPGGTYNSSSVDTSAATADGLSAADFFQAAANNSSASATPASPGGSYSVDTSAATADGLSAADFVATTPANAGASAPAISPAGAAYTVSFSGATADGFSPSDLLSAASQDLIANAEEIAPGTSYAVSTAGAGADGVSSADATSVTASDSIAGAPSIAIGTLGIHTGSAIADGIAPCELLSVAASDLVANALSIGPGSQSGDTDTGGLEGSSTSDDTSTTYKDAFYTYTPQANGLMTLTLDAVTTGAVVSVHSSAPATTATEVASETSTSGNTVILSGFGVTANTTYIIRVACPDTSGTFTLDLAGPNIRRDVFYNYTPRTAGTLSLALAGSADGSVLSIHTGGAATTATAVACSMTSSSTQAAINLAVAADTTYLIRLAGPSDQLASQDFSLTGSAPGVRRDVFYKYIPMASGSASFVLSNGAADGVLSVHTGSPATAGNEVAAVLTTTTLAQASVAVTAGTTYFVRVAEPIDGSDQAFNLDVTGPGVRNDVWYAYTPRATGSATVTLAGSPDDAIVSIHSAVPGTIGNTIASGSAITSGGGSSQASVTFTASSGTTYFIRSANSRSGSGSFSLSLTGPGARKDVYYLYTPQASGNATFALSGSATDSVLSIHSASPATSANDLGSSRTLGAAQASKTLAVTAGTSYLVRLAGPMDALNETFSFSINGPGARKDVWYLYTPQASGNATFSLSGSPDDAVLSIHSAQPGTAANDLGSSRTLGAAQAAKTLAVVGGSTYYVRIAGAKDGSTPAFSFSVAGPNVRKDIWYVYTPRATASATFTLSGSPDDAVISVHSAVPGTTGNEIGSSRTIGATQASVNIPSATAGTSYFVRVAGAKNLATESFSLDVAGPNTRRDVWLKYTPRASGSANLSLSSSADDAVLSVHSATPGTIGNTLASARTVGATQASISSFAVTANTTYLIRIAGPKVGSQTASFDLTGPGVRRDVYFTYRPIAAGNATFTLTGTTNDAVLSVHSASPGTVGNEIGSQLTTTGNQAQVAFAATTGTTYIVRVAGPKDIASQTFSLTTAGPATRRDVWGVYIPSSTGTASAALSGSSAESLVSIHSAQPGTVANSIAGAETLVSQASTTITATAQTSYWIRVAVPFGGTATPNLVLNGPAPIDWIGDLKVTLQSPAGGTPITLFENLPNSHRTNSGAIDFDDAAIAQAVSSSPLTTGSRVQPQEALSAFNGQSPTGNWILSVTDSKGKNVGALTNWSLQISTLETVPADSGDITGVTTTSFEDSGAIPYLFRIPGTYVFTISSPVESFGAETVTGTGDSKTIIVRGPGALQNSAADWTMYP